MYSFAPAVTDRAESWRRGATPCPRSGAVAGRSYSMPEVGAVAEKSNPMSKEWQVQVHGCRRVERSYSSFKVRRGGHEEIPLV